MGLDIQVLVNIERVDTKDLSDDDLESGDLRHLYNEGKNFKPRGGNVKEGCYKTEHSSSFRAGSYSGYGTWRRELCELMLGVSPEEVWENPEAYKDKPFVELINFSDREGYFGTDICAKLAKDFEENRHKLPKATGVQNHRGTRQRPKDDNEYPYFTERYELWADALKTAAENNGVIIFS